ncbi:hypothetical protein M407DRAFT_82392 [Tulasnella calospora MUT 4182]|uniref:GAG-pre-integrase domain-containing protein n=1 Tax=Tulasnella calospora MUT 4182 TaxID=1051891 RepID=A0A0C3KE88_9AGAM|nr:hypothetical protein M407DRAFT_82392 [Tulasnella calospora MUT 4182]
MAQATKSLHASWHRHWGHIGHSSLQEVIHKELVSNVRVVDISGSTTLCDPCLQGKHS